jgi:hypothetical protein
VSLPAPAFAVSTDQEVATGKEYDKQITQQTGVVTDPLLNRWIDDVSQRLWAETARKDVPYNIKILDVADVNAFTTYGGYIYVDEGTLDFAQSDDELAGVIGHETGHNERRHTVTLGAKAQAMSILFGIASIFSPVVYNFGQFAEAGLMAKQQRADELQADQYGLLLMSRAGYDPDAMLSFMRHLGALHDEHSSLVDKYFADHPGAADRVKHLLGYPQLDPTRRTSDDVLVQGLHDLETARYAIAARKFRQVLQADPGNPTALLNLGRAQIALGLPGKGEQSLAEAAAKGNSGTRAAALAHLAALRDGERRGVYPPRPNVAALRDQLAAAATLEQQAAAAIASRRESGRDQLKSLQTRVQSVTSGMPDLSRVQVRKGGRLDAVVRNLNALSRYLDTVQERTSAAIGGAGSLEKGKESGVLRENADILKDLGAPLEPLPPAFKTTTIPPASLALFPSYPRMLGDIAASYGDVIRSLDASRASLAMFDLALGDLDKVLRALQRSQLDFAGDMNLADYNALVPLMQTATSSLSKAAVASGQASQLYNMARARQLQTRITMLGLNYPRDRYATLQHALQERVKNPGLDFDAMLRAGLTPGEVAAASVVAADTGATPEAIVDEAKTGRKAIVEVANARNMDAESLEIFLGLIWLDYADDPDKEAQAHESPNPAASPAVHL